MKTMAEVIDAINYERQMDLSVSNVRALADALTAAGFGPVKAAWDEGFKKGLDRGEWEAAPVREEPKHANPYRASTIEPTP